MEVSLSLSLSLLWPNLVIVWEVAGGGGGWGKIKSSHSRYSSSFDTKQQLINTTNKNTNLWKAQYLEENSTAFLLVIINQTHRCQAILFPSLTETITMVKTSNAINTQN